MMNREKKIALVWYLAGCFTGVNVMMLVTAVYLTFG